MLLQNDAVRAARIAETTTSCRWVVVTCSEDQGEVANVLCVGIRAFIGLGANKKLHQRRRLAMAAHWRWADDNAHQGLSR
mgnify:CR=1 FL=1